MGEKQAYAFFKEYAISCALNKGRKIMHQILLSNRHATSFGLHTLVGKNAEKCLPLKEFPEIANAMMNIDPKVLRELYKVLYLTNEVNDEEDTVIRKKVLEFSGFSVSEDFFIRELMLINMPTDTLRAIKKILCIPCVPLLGLGQKRMVTFIDLLRFLEKPTRTLFAENQSFQQSSSKQLKPKHEITNSNLCRLRPIAGNIFVDGNSTRNVSNSSSSEISLSMRHRHRVYCLKKKIGIFTPAKKELKSTPKQKIDTEAISNKTHDGINNSIEIKEKTDDNISNVMETENKNDDDISNVMETENKNDDDISNVMKTENKNDDDISMKIEGKIVSTMSNIMENHGKIDDSISKCIETEDKANGISISMETRGKTSDMSNSMEINEPILSFEKLSEGD